VARTASHCLAADYSAVVVATMTIPGGSTTPQVLFVAVLVVAATRVLRYNRAMMPSEDSGASTRLRTSGI
jgi:hypothetical protein